MPDISSIPGIQDLWRKTLGDPRIFIAVLDGPIDLSHPCFHGADLKRLESYWMEIDDSKVEEKFPLHATHIASLVFGAVDQ